ncbi:MAG: glycine betaine/proline transport system substrate-binding protein [Pseudonocardiales bacterium]|jgi:glycine betaine/proline transport system substrate-binding protein|nr:glycine/betaine transporter substrate-binding protein [Jatrophihabitans sp.]MDT4929128.1 glycine betaine/proline transport system substrate-binding protein [Pseudonocardiales bacterium]
MIKLNRLAIPLAAAGIVLASVVPGVASNIKDAKVDTTSSCGLLKIAVNNWVGYEADAFVVGQVAKKRLGCIVNYVYVDEQISWQGFAAGNVDVVLENWGHPELFDLYQKKLRVAEDAGSIGINGVIGWFVPPWMAKKYPDITDWKNLNKYSKLFKTSESGSKGQLLDGDPGFVTNDEALVKNLKLNFKVVFAGSEAALIQAFRSAERTKTAMIGYFYSPQWFLAEVPLVKVNLPTYKTGCDAVAAKIACDYPIYKLDKIVSKDFANRGTSGYKLIKNFQWSTKDQNVVAKYITADGMEPEQAADKWIADNPNKVNAWLKGLVKGA